MVSGWALWLTTVTLSLSGASIAYRKSSIFRPILEAPESGQQTVKAQTQAVKVGNRLLLLILKCEVQMQVAFFPKLGFSGDELASYLAGHGRNLVFKVPGRQLD